MNHKAKWQGMFGLFITIFMEVMALVALGSTMSYKLLNENFI